jgi:hypothetical protein
MKMIDAADLEKVLVKTQTGYFYYCSSSCLSFKDKFWEACSRT